jgi:flagellar motor switch/type III secretory pathway protein FliN
MKFGELIRLQPGYIFAVKADLKKPVTIKANCFLTILAWGEWKVIQIL